MTHFQMLVLGIIEGMTEFLPVSSTGHMIIGSSVMGIAEQDFTKVFTVCIQLGAILSVVFLYWKRFMQSREIYLKLFLGFLPAAVIGKLVAKYIDILLGNVIVVALSLFIGGIILLFVDNWFRETEERGETDVTYRSAFVVGVYQVIAMIPGVSRSASTIIGGLTQKLTREAAAEFSFLLAVPTMVAATGYKLYQFHTLGFHYSHQQISTLLLGNIVAFIVAMVSIKSFITYLVRHGFKLFGIYRIIIGLGILVLHFSGYQLHFL